ncbi:sulfotransferase domain-containing protein [Rhodovibrionaceae bacterium A322]
MPYTPPSRRHYTGSLTDTDRWQTFSGRPGDVFVCTPPKCGTTWTIAIVNMLLSGSTDLADQAQVHWIDANVVALPETMAALEAQTSRRCIKTHTPFDGIPWSPDATYIAVYRHPIDVLFSLRKHLGNAKTTPADHHYLATAEEALNHYITQASDPNDIDHDCLATFVRHYQSYAQPPRPDNLLLLHYSDMLADAGRTIETLAGHLGIAADAPLITAIQDATSFSQMKSQADHYAPFAAQGYWRDPKAFFDSASTRKWQGDLTETAITRYQNKLESLLPPEEVAWLEGGNLARTAPA